MSPARKQRVLDRIERLEDRLLWSVSLDPNGWTVVNEPSAKVIYVSSSQGSDSNSGLVQSAPVKSFAKAESLIQSGTATQVLLKSGDTFNDSFQNWTYSGADAQDPVVISYYGGGTRPLIYTGTAGTGFSTQLYGSNGATVNFLDVIGLQFEANLRDPNLQHVSTSTVGGQVGFKFYANGGNVLVEDCSFQYYQENFDIESLPGGIYQSPSISNVTIRRTVAAYAYAFNSGRSQGLYAYNINNLSILQSTFDHNGWNENLYLGAADLGYNHNMYIASTCTGLDVEQSVIAEASYAGIMARAGGTIKNNMFINNPVAVSFGSADGADSTVGGVSGSLSGNTVVGDRASQVITFSKAAGAYVLGAGLAFGQGFVLANTKPGANVSVTSNIFTQDSQNAKPAISLVVATGTKNPTQAVGINDLTVSGNIANGWRVGIQTDGRFVPGGSGIYALNNLHVNTNDFISSTTQEVRHDGSFSTASETWASDRYYDPSLLQSKWITLQGGALPFGTWQSNYDTGATVLTSLPYNNPNVSIVTYDASVTGQAGSIQHFLTQARSLSIMNYQPQYMAQAAVSYIDAGFGKSSSYTVNGPGTPPTATATSLDVNSSALGLTTYTFTVNYTDGAVLNTSSLGNRNLLLDGPSGFSQYATFVSAGTPTIDSAGYQHTAVTYQMTAPNGVWAASKGEDGTYSIELLPSQITDTSGNVAADGIIGSFNVDLTPPTAVATALNLGPAAAGTSSYSFTVAYSDSAGIDTSTLGNFQVQVTGPNGYTKYASYVSQTTSNGIVTATYTVAAPGGSWTSTANGTYSINMLANGVFDLNGNSVTSGVLATFGVNLSGSTSAGTASIAGIVFYDSNGNGTFDNRESTFSGVTIFIDVAGTGAYVFGVDPTTTTDVNGNYSFTSLAAGRYAVYEVAPTGYTVTSPSIGTNVVTLTAGQVATNINFGDQAGNTVVSGTGGSATSGSGGASVTGSRTTGSITGGSFTGGSISAGSITGGSITGGSMTSGSGSTDSNSGGFIAGGLRNRNQFSGLTPH